MNFVHTGPTPPKKVIFTRVGDTRLSVKQGDWYLGFDDTFYSCWHEAQESSDKYFVFIRTEEN